MSFASEEKLWAGSDAGYEIALKAETAMLARTDFETQDVPLGSRLLKIENGLATITIDGPLVNSNSPMLEMFGLVGYPEIDASILEAARDPEVQQILIFAESGGGGVTGVESSADIIETVNKIKPVTGYASTAASAMYWLLSSAGQIYAGRTSLVGSVGVKALHSEYTERDKLEGITRTVVRSGDEKALANPHEKLGKVGFGQIKQAVMATHDIFFDHVVTKRGLNREAASKTVGQSREFIGQAALDAGLVDGIKTYAEVVSDLQRKIVDTKAKTGNNRGKASNNALSGETRMAHKETLSEQEVAALSAGVDLTASTETEVEGADNGEVQNQEITPKADSSLSMLMAQIQTKDDALLQARIKVAKLEEKLVDDALVLDPLRAIVGASVDLMSIGLGGSAKAAALTTKELAAEHARLAPLFKAQYKVGGVAAVTADADVKKKVEFKMTNVVEAQMRALNG